MFKSTTILAIRQKNHVVFVGDGQVSLHHTIVKSQANKIRKIHNDQVLIGFAGSASDAMLLFDMFEKKLIVYSNLIKAAVELIKEWKNNLTLKKLDALLLVADKHRTLLISGAGDILEPDLPVCAIGSGGNYALSAARALIENTNLPLEEIAVKALIIAADICIYTNHCLILQKI